MQHTMRAAGAGEIGARQHADVACVAARSGINESLGVLLTIWVRVAEWQLSEFRPQCFAKTAWAFATVGQLGEKLSLTLARAAKR